MILSHVEPTGQGEKSPQGFQLVGNRCEECSCSEPPTQGDLRVAPAESTPSSATLGHSLLLGQ